MSSEALISSENVCPAQKSFRVKIAHIVILSVAACIGGDRILAAQPRETSLASHPLRPQTHDASPLLFEGLPPDKTGLDFVHRSVTGPKYDRLLNSSAIGGGVCIGDYDGDGLPDVCLTRPAGGFQLYRNLGDFRFTNVTAQAGLSSGNSWSTGATFVDINNDGQLDLYVCCYDSPNRLYINHGNGTFTEEAKAFGLDFNGASIMMAFGDYDRDGRLDAYLLTGGLTPNPSQRFRVKFVDGRPVVPEELKEFWQMFYLPGGRAAAAEAGQFDHLYHHNADGTFDDVSTAAGLSGCDFGNAVVWWDYNGDGWPDLYVANDYFGPDRLYRNNGDGTFTDVAKDALPHTPWTSMGTDIADINNDGLIDLIASDMSGTTRFKRMIDMIDMEKSAWFLEYPQPRQYMRNAVFLNTGTGRFMEAAYLLGLASTDWTWSLVFGDLDNDGWIDLFVPNGMTRDWMDADLARQAKSLSPSDFARFWQQQPLRADRNLAFKNLGSLQFTNVSGSWGLDQSGPSFGAALADLDGDGSLDLVVNQFEAPCRLYRNRNRDGHRVLVRLEGNDCNRSGIGSIIRVQTASTRQMRAVTLSHGFMSASESVVQFGLAADSHVEELIIEWPCGRVQNLRNLDADRLYVIPEPSNSDVLPKSLPPTPQLFERSTAFKGLRHEAEAFDDFKVEPLLPSRLSQMGPGLAWSDINGDGQEDLYVTGTSRQRGQLFINGGPGIFRLEMQPAFQSKEGEAAALFFDANSDGHEDLYVIMNRGLAESNSAPRRDLLYLNDGKGRFALAPEGTVPVMQDVSVTVVAGDFDRDGDLDLFIGGRNIPGKYPLTPASYLLRNDHGTFTDVTAELAPSLQRPGLVTSAIWSDVDNDGWLDLLLTCEWGTIRLFHNEQGRLVERTAEAGLATHTGWWNAIVGADIDQDGDIDFVVCNRGLNSSYQPTLAEPCRLYYGDFDGRGQPQLIEATVTADGLFPNRGKSALEKAMPGLLARFPTHHRFAAASLSEIVQTNRLESAYKLEVNTAESGILFNDGHGKFEFRPLPRIAQIAPSYGAALMDVDGDGFADLYLVQNTLSTQAEIGQMDGGCSLLMLGKGNGQFEPVWPNRSGLVVPGDGKSLTATDLNGDGWVDFLVGVNNSDLLAFENRGSQTNRILRVKLAGKPGNLNAVGARVTIAFEDGRRHIAEVYGGDGYLSQSTSTLFFGLGARSSVKQVDVRWPNGRTTTHPVEPSARFIQIQE